MYLCVKKVGFEQSPGVIAVLAVEDLIARGGARAAGSAAKAASGMSHSTPHHTPTSQPQGPAILKKEGGGGGGGAQATYQKTSNRSAFDAELVGKPSLRENVGEKLKKRVNKEVGGGAPSTNTLQGSNKPINVTARDKIVENPVLVRNYVKEMERITKLELPRVQKDELIKALRKTEFKKLDQVAQRRHRREFDNVKDNLRKQWEKQSGQEWPVYKEDVFFKNGVKARRSGEPYDAHHIIEVNHGGPNKWWNIHPAHALKEHTKIHGKGSANREIFRGKK